MMMKFAVAVGVLSLCSAPAFANGTQPYSHDVTLFAYEKQVDNFCPAGTQPIRYNGVICCGEPTAYGYGDAPVVRHKPKATYTKAPSQSSNPKSPNYAPERIPMGKSPNS